MNLFEKILLWRKSRAEFMQLIASLREENQQLRAKVAQLQHAKDEAEQSLSERRREKEVLRTRIKSQEKLAKSAQLSADQLSAKVTELREENERLSQGKRHRK